MSPPGAGSVVGVREACGWRGRGLRGPLLPPGLLATWAGCWMPGLHLPSLGLSGTLLFLGHPARGSGASCRRLGAQTGGLPRAHSCLGAGGCGPGVMRFGSCCRSASPKGRSEDDSYDEEMLSAIEGLSSTRWDPEASVCPVPPPGWGFPIQPGPPCARMPGGPAPAASVVVPLPPWCCLLRVDFCPPSPCSPEWGPLPPPSPISSRGRAPLFPQALCLTACACHPSGPAAPSPMTSTPSGPSSWRRTSSER